MKELLLAGTVLLGLAAAVPLAEAGETKHIMIRIVTDDYLAWLAVHYEFAETRKTFGMTDGPVYRDIDNQNAAFFHIMTEDLPRALQWFQDPRFREASVRAKVKGREFYIAEQRK